MRRRNTTWAPQLLAAWRGQLACEATIVSNLILGRTDHIGCPVLTPIDALGTHLGRAVVREAGNG